MIKKKKSKTFCPVVITVIIKKNLIMSQKDGSAVTTLTILPEDLCSTCRLTAISNSNSRPVLASLDTRHPCAVQTYTHRQNTYTHEIELIFLKELK